MALEIGADRNLAVVLLFVLGAVAVYFITVTLGGFLLGAALVALLIVVAFIVGGRLWDKFRHGKPVFRGGGE